MLNTKPDDFGRENEVLVLEELLKCPRNPNVADKDGCAPLHHLAETEHVTPALLLLEARANVDEREFITGRPCGLQPQRDISR